MAAAAGRRGLRSAGPEQAGFVRFEAAEQAADGTRAGIFTQLRLLRDSGALDDGDAAVAATLVARSYVLHDEPDARHFATDPPALSWFRDGDDERATAARRLAADVVGFLRRYGVRCREVRSLDPGRVTFADDVQVVAVPPS